MPDTPTSVTRRDPQHIAARTTATSSPFRMLERFADEMDRMFDDFGFGRAWHRRSTGGESIAWAPRVDVTQQNNELVIRADLPGLSKDDVTVDITDDAVTIQGERRRESQQEHGGVYRTERTYGSFYRSIPLPDGAIVDQAKASFKNGVLEITMPAAPEQVNRGRRVEISDAAGTSK